MINKDIKSLDIKFQKKVALFLQEAKNQGLNIMIFEGLRSIERQKALYAIGRTTEPNRKPVTWTLKSNHLTGKAVDIVFNVNWQPSWNWDYNKLIIIAKRFWIENLKPKETCHFEDNWIY